MSTSPSPAGLSLTLVYADLQFSSWALRAWFAVTLTGLDVKLAQADPFPPGPEVLPRWREHVTGPLPVPGRVPVLVVADDKGQRAEIWESTSIIDFLTELSGPHTLWPSNLFARAVCRSVVSEMHAGYSNIRCAWPMDGRANRKGKYQTGDGVSIEGMRRDLKRLSHVWTTCRKLYGEMCAEGDDGFLFGKISAADAMFAPVILRLHTYHPDIASMGDVVVRYYNTVLESEVMRKWAEIMSQQPERWLNEMHPAYMSGWESLPEGALGNLEA